MFKEGTGVSIFSKEKGFKANTYTPNKKLTFLHQTYDLYANRTSFDHYLINTRHYLSKRIENTGIFVHTVGLLLPAHLLMGHILRYLVS